jgi:hypothetical protein
VISARYFTRFLILKRTMMLRSVSSSMPWLVSVDKVLKDTSNPKCLEFDRQAMELISRAMKNRKRLAATSSLVIVKVC